MRAVSIAAALGVLLGLALAVFPAEARPGGQFPMLMRLSGEWSRPAQVDGGGLRLTTTDAGIAETYVTGGEVYVVTCDNAGYLCLYDGTLTQQAWDGGCNGTADDANRGLYVGANTNMYVITQNNTSKLFGAPASGATLNCPVYLLK